MSEDDNVPEENVRWYCPNCKHLAFILRLDGSVKCEMCGCIQRIRCGVEEVPFS